MSDLTPHTRDDLVELPSDCPLPEPDHSTLYTIDSNRSRYQIVADYAARHDLSARQVDALVRQLPDYGVKSMLAGSVAVLRRCQVICLAEHRARKAGRG